MLEVDSNGIIQLTRGDTAKLSIDITNDVSETDYILQEDDVLRFTVKKSTSTKDISFQKVCQGDNLIHIEPGDTNELPYGGYVYDVELTRSNGDVYTVIPPTKFILLKEVTW